MRGINRWVGGGATRRTVLKGLGAGAVATAAGTRWGKVYAGSEITLNLLLSNMPWCEALTSTISEEYNKATNGRVSVTGDLTPYESHYEKIVLELSSQSPTYDVVTSDCFWVRQWMTNNWVVCADDMAAANPDLPKIKYDNLYHAARIYQQYQGKSWGIPGNMSTPIFVWRKDLLEKAGIEKEPRNWAEYLAAAKAMKTDEVGGAMMLLGGQDSCMGDFLSRVMGRVEAKSPGDDFILNEDNEPIFDQNDGAEIAIEQMKELVPYCPKGVFNFDYPEASSVMQSGGSAMLVCWIDIMPGFESSPLAGKFGYTVAPADVYQQQMVGGWSMLINAASAHTEEAYRFLAWLADGKGFEMMRDYGETSLVYVPDLENKEITSKIPSLGVFDDFKKYGTKWAALFPYRVVNADQCQRTMYEEVIAAISGDKPTKQALTDAKDRLWKLLKG